MNLIEVDVLGIRLEMPHQQPVIILKEQTGKRYLPIWIGSVEASSIAIALQDKKPPRPMTHDLLISLLEKLEATVSSVNIVDIKDGTFIAQLHMVAHGVSHIEDCRPSDAIAIAVRVGVPVFVSADVLESSFAVFEDMEDNEETVEEFKQFLESVKPEDFGI